MRHLSQHGSLVNLICDNAQQPTPVVGMGATSYSFSDREPYTVIAILSPHRIVVQADNYERKDDNGMSDCQDYTFTPNPEGHKTTLRRRKDGGWAVVGSPGSHFGVGHRSRYYDFSF